MFYERSFRVRHYECDMYGHMNHANYVRIMQETAFDASAAVGYDFAQYQTMQRLWLVRETDITYYHPASYGDTLIIKTWVADFRRVRSRRMYECRLAHNGELAAKAHTDWVFLDSENLRPATIPPAMITAFLPDGSGETAVKYGKFPKAPLPPPGVFKTRRKVRWQDIDTAGHVNNSMYFVYLEDCGTDISLDRGWPMQRLLQANIGIVARNYRLEYLQPAFMDDELEIATWFSDVRRATAVRHYTIKRPLDNQLLVRARAFWVWIDLQTGRPVRIPSDFLADFRTNQSRAE